MSADAGRFVEQYAPPPPAAEDREDDHLHPISGELQCYGVAKDNRRPPAMLVLRLKTGDQKALMYAYLVEVDFDPSEGITLRFVSHEVTIRGRNLEPLFGRLVEHRVSWVRVVDESRVGTEDTTVVTAIETQRR